MAWDTRFYERLVRAEETAARRALTDSARARHEALAQRYRGKLDEIDLAMVRNEALSAAAMRAAANSANSGDSISAGHLMLVSSSLD